MSSYPRGERPYIFMARWDSAEEWSEYLAVDARDETDALRYFIAELLPIASDCQFLLIHRRWPAGYLIQETVMQFMKQNAQQAYRRLQQIIKQDMEKKV